MIPKYSVPGQAKGRAFLEWASTDLSFKLFFTCRGNVNYYKSVIILFLLFLWQQETPRQFSKRISKLSIQLSVQVCSLLGQSESEKKAFLEGARTGATFLDYLQQQFVVIRDEKYLLL